MLKIMLKSTWLAYVESMECHIAKLQEKALRCAFCNQKMATLGGLQLHSAECENHPLHARVMELKRIAIALSDSNAELSNLLKQHSDAVDKLNIENHELKQRLEPATVKSVLTPGHYVARVRQGTDEEMLVVASSKSKGEFKDKLQQLLHGPNTNTKIIDYRLIEGMKVTV